MPRRRGSGVLDLPEGVHAVKTAKATYYYWHPNRGTRFAGKAVPLGKDPFDPDFGDRLRKAQGYEDGAEPGSFAALIRDYKKSHRYRKRSPRTQRHYTHQLGRIEAAWGALQVSGLSVAAIYRLRAEYEETPVAANHLISMLRTLLKWGLQHGYGTVNPAREIEDIQIEDEENAKPWPEWAYRLILDESRKRGYERIYRAVYLGRACGQRRSDLVKLGKRHRERDGLGYRVGKLRNKPHFQPLTEAQLREIDSWDCTDTGPWVLSAGGVPMDGDNLQSTLNRLVEKITRDVPELRTVEIKMHGLRALAACDRKLAGAENKAIAANLRMSTQMVERYIRHIDEEALARGVRDKLERAANGNVKPFERPL